MANFDGEDNLSNLQNMLNKEWTGGSPSGLKTYSIKLVAKEGSKTHTLSPAKALMLNMIICCSETT